VILLPRLEEWSVFSKNSYQAPEAQKRYLQGNIYNDDRFEDGTIVQTSSIQELNLKENYAITRNTEYILGEISKDYVEWMNKMGLSLEDYMK